MSVAELRRMIDGARALAMPAGDDGMARSEDLAARFTARLTATSPDELEAAKQPHPHAFQQGDCGLFPTAEVTVIAAPGREGKTYTTIGLAVPYVLGHRVVGLKAQRDRSVMIYSAEDDRAQYVRKLAAQCARLGREDAEKVLQRIIIPDLQAEGMEMFQTLVGVPDRQPMMTQAVDVVIDAMRPRMAAPIPPGILIFETASTLSEAEEDNRAFRILVRALKRIARQLQIAVVLVHHTSQAAGNALPDMAVSVADIRGATALAFNSRQNFILVNLGSDAEPHPDNDARTVLRSLAAPDIESRVSCLICLDSSKSMDPPPIFFEWQPTAYGPALPVLNVPQEYVGMRWRKLRQVIQAQRAEARQSRKDSAQSTKVEQVVALVCKLSHEGQQPTVRKVSSAAGHGAEWAAPYLEQAVDSGRLIQTLESIPRTRGESRVYRPADLSASNQQADE